MADFLYPHRDVACRMWGSRLRGGKPSWLPYIASGSLYKHAKARHGLPVRVRQILSKYEMKRMALAISVPNLAGIHQSILKLYQTAHHPALPPDLGACPWRLSLACDSRGLGGGWRQGWGLVWLSPQRNSSRSYYFALFSEVTWHLGHVIDLKHSL